MDFARARLNMVENQIRTNRVTDPLVVEAMAELPREAFVPEHLKGIAYVDEDIALGGGRYLMEPLVLAHLLQAAQVGEDDTVLEIAGTTGYATAVLARIARSVVAVESDATLAGHARAALAEVGLTNAEIVEGPLDQGCASKAPYDVIVVGGGVGEVPSAIVDQLADGGRLVAVVVEDGVGSVTVFVRVGDIVSRRAVFAAQTPLLPGFQRAPGFVF